MTLEIYSTLLSVALAGLLALVLIVFAAYLFSSRVQKKLQRVGYYHYLWIIGILTSTGVVGALVYEYVYHTPVCELCWYQRVFIIPIALIALMGAYWRIQKADLLIGLFSVLGFLVAGYHYYLHFRSLILEQDVLTPCGGGLLPSCADSPILVWGFVTIPLFSIGILSVVMAILYIARRSKV